MVPITTLRVLALPAAEDRTAPRRPAVDHPSSAAGTRTEQRHAVAVQAGARDIGAFVVEIEA